ncbi:MAG TPA: TIGR03067 domain-containing protein [Nitrospira sp.]|nr:TIGR03067 domain-containing protein [Nitrospira sp.]
MIYSSTAKAYLAISVLVLLAMPACTGRSPDQPKADLTGEYRIISGERNGAPIDQGELTDTSVYINDKIIIVYDKERKEMFASTYTLETNQKPWHVTMISTKSPDVGAIAKGLVEADQNKVKLIYALPNGQPPTSFKAGEQQQMFVMEKAGTAGAKG